MWTVLDECVGSRWSALVGKAPKSESREVLQFAKSSKSKPADLLEKSIDEKRRKAEGHGPWTLQTVAQARASVGY
jgi:transposase